MSGETRHVSDDRVLLVAHSLPAGLAAKLDDRVLWLLRQLPKLDAALGIDFPPIVVLPLCLTGRWRDGTETVVAANVTTGQFGDYITFIIQLCAPVLLEWDDDSVIGLLAHEFLHVAHLTMEQMKSAGGSLGPDPLAYSASAESYHELDRNGLADPNLWLDAESRERMEQLDARRRELFDLISSKWLDQGLPRQEKLDGAHGREFAAIASILRKAQQLALV